jgi:GNAT superfamily N-acetyltransferase
MSPLSTIPGRIGTLEAQKLLDVSVPGGFAVWLDEHWRAELQELLEGCAEDVHLLTGALPDADTATRILGTVPPSGNLEDKFVVGVFDAEGRLAGVLVVVRDLPGPGDWTANFLLVRADQRGRGLAGRMLQSLEAWVRSEGGRALWLEALRHNPAGSGFARRAGFLPAPGAGDPPAVVHYVRRLA